MLKNVISQYDEMLAYETLWGLGHTTLKSFSQRFDRNKPILPSEILKKERDLLALDIRERVEKFISPKLGKFSILLNKNFQYPRRIREAKYPVELLYYRGDLSLLDVPSVSIVGSRQCSPIGLAIAESLTTGLVNHGYVTVSGLAKGVDTVVHKTTINNKGFTIAVIGTPIDHYYPQENKGLQDLIGNEHLLISQVPFYRYEIQPFSTKKYYFPERNVTMAALSEATIIVEASDTSGTLIQARACMQQNRLLFIHRRCLENKSLKWPTTYIEKGAIVIDSVNDVLEVLDEYEGKKYSEDVE